MDHKEQHHQRHRKEREHEKQLAKTHEAEEAKSPWPIYPKWFVVLGIVVVVAALLAWTFLVW